MAGATITVSLAGDDLGARFGALAGRLSDTTPLMRAIGAGMRDAALDRFERGRDPDGRPWPGWSAAYAAVTKSSGLLRNAGMRGGLMGSLTFAATRTTMQLGSNKVYAAIHQFGGTIVPRRARALVFRLGRRVVFAQKVTIPARPYLGFGPKEREVVGDVLEAALARALRGA